MNAMKQGGRTPETRCLLPKSTISYFFPDFPTYVYLPTRLFNPLSSHGFVPSKARLDYPLRPSRFEKYPYLEDFSQILLPPKHPPDFHDHLFQREPRSTHPHPLRLHLPHLGSWKPR